MKIIIGENEKGLELSYIDLIVAIGKDIGTDESMPESVKANVKTMLTQLFNVLYPYSN